MEPSTKISRFSSITIDEAVDREMTLLATEPNVTNYQLPVKDIRNKIYDLESVVEELKPHGTDKQVKLGDGTLTQDEDEYGEFNAPSSLFNKAVFGDAFDFVYGQFANKGCKLGWEEFINLIGAELVNRGIIVQPPDWSVIASVNLSIDAPVNGTEQVIDAEILDNDPNYTVGELVWEPSGIWNGTNEYEVVFSIIPNEGFFFIFPLTIKINGEAPTYANGETDGSLTIAKRFPATMTANPNPNLSIAAPAYGESRPNTATRNDSGHYSVAIDWSPVGATYPSGISTGTFTLTANAGYRWNSNKVSLNGTNYNGNLKDNGMILSFTYKSANLNSNQGTFTDTRDGKIYNWKLMPDGKKWMTVNLDYAGNGGLYYDNAGTPPFANAGRLYTWEQAKAAAPAGWHLPSVAEWDALMTAVGGSSTAGTKLKATSGWNNNGNGTDEFGFAALPGGFGHSDGNFSNVGSYGYWWSASEGSSNGAYIRRMNYDNEGAYYSNYLKDNLYSVRCLQD